MKKPREGGARIVPAVERGRVQREILVEATRGHASLDTVDLDAADRLVDARLSVVPL